MSYYTDKNTYKCYKNEDYDNTIWIKVIEIIETTHPDKKVCFNGKIKVIKLPAPKKIKLSDKYDTFDKYMALYECDYKNDNGKYGYMRNPNYFYDWWQLGGRWSGYKIKGYNPRKDKRNHEKCNICNGSGYRGKLFCNACCNESRDGWEIEKGIAVKWPGWNHLDVNYLHVSKIEDDTSCFTIIYKDILKHQKIYENSEFIKTDFDGNMKKFINKYDIKDGYFLTIDYHD
jgi:hypothetical protein